MIDPGADDQTVAHQVKAPTFHDLLERSGLGLQLIHSDSGDRNLGRAISWSHTTELQDPSRYLRGGELVCTVGISLQTPADCRTFVDSLARAGVSGICFGIGDVHDSAPPGLIEASARHGLPLLVAPPQIPFATVSRYIADFQFGGVIATARATNALVPELLSSQRRRESVRALLDRAGQVLGCYFLLEAPGAVVDSPASIPVDELGTVVWLGRGDPPDSAVLEVIARFVAASQGERDIEAALARERVGQLLSLVERRMLLPDALHQLLDWPGLAEREIDCSAWPAGAGALLSMAFPDALVADAPEVCLVLSTGTDRLADIAADLALPSGHAAAVPLTELGSSISQARIALDLARQRGGSIGPDQLSTFGSLLEGLTPSRLAPFKTQLIDPLIGLDRDRGTQHVRTLRVFLAANGSLIETARELFLHTNTVRHRLARISQITGRDPLKFEDQAAFTIGLRAADRL